MNGKLYPTVAEVEELRKFEREEYKRKHHSMKPLLSAEEISKILTDLGENATYGNGLKAVCQAQLRAVKAWGEEECSNPEHYPYLVEPKLPPILNKKHKCPQCWQEM